MISLRINSFSLELEFKGDMACATLLAYTTSKDENEFAQVMSSKALELVRFIELDRSRIYNCTTCDWWMNFLQNVEAAGLPRFKVKFNKYVRALQYQKRNNAASLVTLFMCNRENVLNIFIEGLNKATKTTKAIFSDFRAVQELDGEAREQFIEEQSATLTGFDFWRQHYGCTSDDEFYSLFEEDIKNLSEMFVNIVSEVVA